jgi:hypothetical protein
MPNSKIRRRKPKLQTSPQVPTMPVSRKEFRQSKLRAFANHPASGLASLIASVVTIGTLIWQAFVQPEIVVSEVDATSPFAAPITITNRSFIFTMRDTHVRCGVEKISTSGGSGIYGIGFEFLAPRISIEPGTSANFQCKIAAIPPPNKLIAADIFVEAKYYTWRFPRNSEDAEFTWFTQSTPPRWIKGAFPGNIHP